MSPVCVNKTPHTGEGPAQRVCPRFNKQWETTNALNRLIVFSSPGSNYNEDSPLRGSVPFNEKRPYRDRMHLPILLMGDGSPVGDNRPLYASGAHRGLTCGAGLSPIQRAIGNKHGTHQASAFSPLPAVIIKRTAPFGDQSPPGRFPNQRQPKPSDFGSNPYLFRLC